MAQVDMKDIKNKTTNTDVKSTKIDKSNDVKPAETHEDAGELIDNTPDESENHSEATEENKETTGSDKVVVQYVGNSVWKDTEGKLWSRENKTKNILSTRQYKASEYEERSDLKFMVGYGEMKVTYVRG